MIFDISDRDFISIMRKNNLSLPKRWVGGDFHFELSKLYEKYMNEIQVFLPAAASSEINKICIKIKEVLEKYLNGYIKEAYDDFAEIMQTLYANPLKEYIKNSWGENIVREDQLKLYRVRYIQGNSLIDPKLIFHVPNNLRSKISTCRYSISGFPSLYMGTCLKLCVEESPASAFNDQLVASRFEVNRDYYQNGNVLIKVFDLAIRPSDFVYYRNKNDEIKKGLDEINLEDPTVRSNYLLWYPLISGCSYMRTNRSDPFAVEYILPQFLMQWIRSIFVEKELIGIRYFSCASQRASNMGYNYVFPVSGKWSASNEGFCKILAGAFKFTDPRYLKEFESVQELESKLNTLVAKNLDGK